MQIYLINLDCHADRLAHMRAQLKDLAFQRVPAVDGSKRPPTTKGLTRFELACLESHKTAWRRFLDGSESCACFLEDDLHIWPGFAGLIETGVWVPQNAHCVKLDTYFQRVELGERQAAIDDRQIARLYNRHKSSAAYILTRAGATRYLESAFRTAAPADYLLFPKNPRLVGLRIYQLTPAIAIQDHLLPPVEQRQLQTAIADRDRMAARGGPSRFETLRLELGRLPEHFSGLVELAYQKTFLRVETATVGVR
jgi:glycosyl transferase family 25